MGLLGAALKDLMGYKRMLIKTFDERNVTVSEDMGTSPFSEGFGQLGHLLKQKAGSFASL